MRPIVVTCGAYAPAVANNIAQSQAPGAGAITLNGSTVTNGIATLDTARRAIFTSGGNDSGITFTIAGTDRSGQAKSETLAGANAGVATTALDYLTITGVTHTGSIASTLTIGTAASGTVGSSQWIRADDFGLAAVSLQVDVSGTMQTIVETSNDDVNLAAPQIAVAPASMVWLQDKNIGTGGTITASANDVLTAKPLWVRLTCQSYSSSAVSTLTVVQAGGKLG